MTLVRRLVEAVAARLAPPRVIYDRDGRSPYLSRYYLLGAPIAEDGGDAFDQHGAPREGIQWKDGWGVYLHRFHRSDEDADPHNHPWRWSASLILAGGYIEHRKNAFGGLSSRLFSPGNVNVIRANDFHLVHLVDGDAWTLFFAGPKVQSWGFFDLARRVFVPWREYIDRRRGTNVYSLRRGQS